ncbi:proline-rich protein PRCC [Denticeps clupeoides]|uniref:Proline-rich protein PRCC n=1 Tax=Denticeps clupeoides TaxID=299321 RepID=A0AAY4C9J7_9TELE|nr:proline-rich protein PRCC [Denticeps clupeoides]
MSLVAYGSSDDSDSEDASLTPAPQNKPGAGLFASLPTPRNAGRAPAPGPAKARRAGEPVKISVPEIRQDDDDSDDGEPVRKRAASQQSGLSSLLPQPKNLVVKETQRALVPHALTKRPASATSASPSAIKAAAKSAALHLARQMAAEDGGSDDELPPENYFSLSDVPQPPPVVPVFDPLQPPPPSLSRENVSLHFDSQTEGSLVDSSNYEVQQRDGSQLQYQDASEGPVVEPSNEGFYSDGFCPDPDVEPTQAEEQGSSSLFDDEAFRRLQGKRNQGKEEIKFLDIRGDDQLSGTQQWMTKNMTEEKEQRKSFSKRKGGQPTGQQRRKHQITYLIHQAKERELELKNSWAENKLTRRQTQAKYGF